MNRKEAIRLVELLLDMYANKNFSDSGVMLAYQRGYLTGILADLIRDDFYAEQQIQKKINSAKKK